MNKENFYRPTQIGFNKDGNFDKSLITMPDGTINPKIYIPGLEMCPGSFDRPYGYHCRSNSGNGFGNEYECYDSYNNVLCNPEWATEGTPPSKEEIMFDESMEKLGKIDNTVTKISKDQEQLSSNMNSLETNVSGLGSNIETQFEEQGNRLSSNINSLGSNIETQFEEQGNRLSSNISGIRQNMNNLGSNIETQFEDQSYNLSKDMNNIGKRFNTQNTKFNKIHNKLSDIEAQIEEKLDIPLNYYNLSPQNEIYWDSDKGQKTIQAIISSGLFRQ